MPSYQNTGLATTGSLMMGSVKVEVAASALGTYTNLGLARGVSITENIVPYAVQADNGPDPIHGISRQTATVEFEMMEFYLPTLDILRGTGLDLDNHTTGTYLTTTCRILTTGGLSELNDRAVKFTNHKLVSAATVETVIVFYKAHITSGLQIALKSDNDEDPVNVYPQTLEAVMDTERAAGDQLYIIESEIGA